MGTADATIGLTFVVAHTLTVETEHGSVKITGSLNQSLSSPAPVGESKTVTVTATAETGYHFTGWTVSDEVSSVADPSNAHTTFTMGTADVTLTATFAHD